MTGNTLYFGDNLRVLREQFGDASVDLVYLDPPFNSKRDYNMVFRLAATEEHTAQVRAFEDTWSFEGAAEAFYEVTNPPSPVGKLLEGMRAAFGDTALLGYLSVMALRLRELHRVLKPTGSLYLHCDPTADHCLRMVLDAVFGPGQFRNEIIWRRSDPKGHAFTRFPATHDVLICYARGERPTWNAQYLPHAERYIRSHYRHVEGATGRRYRLSDCTNPNPDRPNLTYEWNGITRVWRWTRERMQELHDAGRLVYTKSGMPEYKRYLDEMPGTPATDVVVDVPPLNSQARERLGYPTQKPLALLERIIAASSSEGDLVLDPFCGCGTAVVAAQKLGRRWAGIDITTLAVNLIGKRLQDSFPEAFPTPSTIPVVGLPVDVAGARMLAHESRYAFEHWALMLVGAVPAGGGTKKKGADRGVDGEFGWRDNADRLQRGLVSVKSGHVSVAHIRDLIGTMQREKAAMGLYVSLEEPTRAMRTEAAGAGRYALSESTPKTFPAVQVATIDDLLAGRLPDLPRYMAPGYADAPRLEGEPAQQSAMDLDDD
jgi:site-specific DNA-methyltransferase (adenine-specific)